MYTSLNHNLIAANAARNLNTHYANLATSTRRLSSGLRVNSAADDAAGLAIRELMRADIAATNQGVRNVNDAISMLQVADGALAIIDEKLIRMKELAEQAATGTYNSTQRLMIDSEFQAMAAEIDRIANATDFNGIKLLDGSKQGEHDGSSLNSTGAIKVHFGSGNDSAEDFYDININDASTLGLGLKTIISLNVDGINSSVTPIWLNDVTFDQIVNGTDIRINFEVNGIHAGSTGDSKYAVDDYIGMDYYILPKGFKNVFLETSNDHPHMCANNSHISLFTNSGVQLVNGPSGWNVIGPHSCVGYYRWWHDFDKRQFLQQGKEIGFFDDDILSIIDRPSPVDIGDEVLFNKTRITLLSDLKYPWSTEYYFKLITGPKDNDKYFIPEINDELILTIGSRYHYDRSGPHDPNRYANGVLIDTSRHSNYESMGDRNKYNLKISADVNKDFFKYENISIKTQEQAQQALVKINEAIVTKDKIRTNLGAIQNRLENTATSLSVQFENLQAAESRISDADIAEEMTNFVRNQILTQSAVAMLGQANSMPQMLMKLIQ